MAMQQIQPEIDYQICLDALEIAIRTSKEQFNSNTVRSLKLTCKGLKRVADDLFLRSLTVSKCLYESEEDFKTIPPDFEILTPALLKNVRDISIFLDWEEDAATIQNYIAGSKRILGLTSHNLRKLFIIGTSVPTAELLKGNLAWPNLKELSFNIGSIAGAKEELYSMRQLRSLCLQYVDSNNKDRKALLSAPFLANLTRLELFLSSSQTLTPLYMSKLLVRTKQLESLRMHGNLDFDYFGGIHLENLKHLELRSCGDVDLAPLLAQPRPNLQTLWLNYGFILNEELHNFINSAKEAFPKLTCLSLGQLGSDLDEHQDWSCLERINLPNLTDLLLPLGFREIVGLVKPTAELPKLRKLNLGLGYKAGHPLDWENNAEEIFSSPLLHQLEELSIYNSHFRLGSLAILCEYATQFKYLVSLEVHCYDMEGVRIIANAGRVGGFPNLEKISFYDMAPGFKGSISWINGEQYYYLIECLLRPVWPDIKYRCWIGRGDKMEKYGQPDEFVEVDEIEELQDLNLEEGDNDEVDAE